jgi:nitrogen regulatory protein P-II 1
MKLIIAYIRPESLNAVKQALYAKSIYSMSVTNIKGAGRQKGFTETYRGVMMEVNLLNKVRIELALPDERIDEVVEVVKSAARTGREGDGIIIVQPVEKAYRIRTGEDSIF